MGQMKKLLIDTIEFEDQIIQLLKTVREELPTVFALFFDDDLSSKVITKVLRQFTIDDEIVALTVAAIEFNMVDFGNIPKEKAVLSLKFSF